MKALCFGSLNIDYTYKVSHFVSKGETLASESLQVFCGGKGLNQSIALAKGGARTYHAGAVGKDGIFLLEELAKAGVCTDCVKVIETEKSGHAIIQNDAGGDNCILLYGGANQAIKRAQIDETLKLFAPGDLLILQNEINEIPYLMEQAHKRGLKIVLTPAPMESALLQYPLELVDFLLLNRVEAVQLLNLERDVLVEWEELVDDLADRFPRTEIVLTLGGEGAIFICGEKRICQPAYPVKAVDTTAAGDTFAGFFLAGRMRGCNPKETMEIAAKAAAISVTRQGASPSIPTLEEVKRWNAF